MTAVETSMTKSACLGLRCLRSRFHVQTYELSVLQSPSSILNQEKTVVMSLTGKLVSFSHDLGQMTYRPKAQAMTEPVQLQETLVT